MLRENTRTRLEIPNASEENTYIDAMEVNYMRPVIFHRFRQISTEVYSYKSRDLSRGKRAQIIAPH